MEASNYPNSYIEALEIDKPEKWLTKSIHEAGEFINDKADVFNSMTGHFLLEAQPEMIAIVNSLPPLQEGLVRLLKLLFSVGYLKGLSVGESRATTDKLDKMWKEE